MTIVGGTLTNLAINIGRRHPLRDAPLIDWDLILVMEPSTILGAILGTYVNVRRMVGGDVVMDRLALTPNQAAVSSASLAPPPI